MNGGKATPFGDQSGAVALMAALGLAIVLVMAALAIDIGHLVTAKAELQSAADAGALAGARGLVPYNTAAPPPQPNWALGQSRASQAVRVNQIDGVPLTDCQAQPGYWNLALKTLQSTGIVPTSNDVPAIKVTLAKAAGANGGPVRMMFAPILGRSFCELRAQALAFISAPSGIPPHGGLFPLATPKALVDQYWPLDHPVSATIIRWAVNGLPFWWMPTTFPPSGTSLTTATPAPSISATISGFSREPRTPCSATRLPR
jgi:Putative Flp pilus-assembly TadE/G-like